MAQGIWTRRALVVAVVLALFGAACTGGDDTGEATTTTRVVEEGGTLRIGVVEIPSLDPADTVGTVALDLIVADLLYDGLTTLDPFTGEVVPALASWEASDDLRTWTFSLPTNARFSDGSPITAEDVVVSLSRVAARGDESIAGVRLEVVDGYIEVADGSETTLRGVVAEDPQTVVITTLFPFAELPALLADPAFGIVPASVAEADTYPTEPVTSSAFAVTGIEEDRVTLEAVGEGPAYLDGIELVGFDSREDSYAAFRDGGLDWSQVPPGEIGDARERYGDGQFVDFHVELWLGMNLSDPTLADERVRQAAVLALDREALVSGFYPAGIPLRTVVPAGYPGHDPDVCGDLCGQDPERATDLVDAVRGAGGSTTVAIDYGEEDVDSGLVDELAVSLEEVGLTVERRPHGSGEYRAVVARGEASLFLYGWAGVGFSPDTYLAPLFVTGAPENVTFFADPAVDAALADARGTAEPEERYATYRAAEEAILAAAPIVPLVQLQRPVVVSERVEDLVSRPNATFDAPRVWLDQ